MSAVPAPSALLRLTPRDRALITVLYELRYLTAGQIQQACYPTITVASTSSRLSVLRRRGLLDCLRHRTFGDRRAFWGLTARGRAAAAALAGGPVDRAGASAVAALHMEHFVATNQIFCDLCREHRAGRLPEFRWLGSHHAPVDLGHTRLVPDAVILVPSPSEGWWMYFLELDRNTMSEAALAEKFDRYALMQRIAASRPDDPEWEARADSWVLFACPDEGRAAAAARLAEASGLERIWAGTMGACASGLAAGIRLGVDGTALAAKPLPGLAAPAGGIGPPPCPDSPEVQSR